MKKLIFTLLAILSCTFANAQASYGEYVYFPKYQFAGYAYIPKLAFGKVNDQDLLVLRYVDPYAYSSFDQSSQLLLKIGDDIIHIPMSKVDTKISRDYSNIRAGGMLYEHYITYTSFDIDKETVDRIVNKKESISKVRIIFTNGDIKDYEVKPKNQAKLTEGLIKSYQSVAKSDTQRKTNMDNDEAGF